MRELIYTVQVAPTIKALTEQVQGSINKGWLPLGGATNYGGRWHQTMLLEIDIPQEEIDARIAQKEAEDKLKLD